MYTVPKPSNGAPTAMSGKERYNGVTPRGLWAPCLPNPVLQPQSPAWPWPHPARQYSDHQGTELCSLGLKLGPSCTQLSTFICGKVSPREGSDLSKVTKQVNVSSRPTFQIPDHWLVFIFPYYSAFHLPYQPSLQTLVSSNVIYQQGHKSR